MLHEEKSLPMNNTARRLFRTAAILQMLTGLVHSLNFLKSPEPKNDTEKQLMDLMQSYKMELGAGFAPSMADLLNCMSACFTLLCLFGGIMNYFLLKKQVPDEVMKGVIHINLFAFGILFLVTALLTFLPPILFTGAIFFALLSSRIFYKST